MIMIVIILVVVYICTVVKSIFKVKLNLFGVLVVVFRSADTLYSLAIAMPIVMLL